jgi:hypothetical protein
MGATRAQGHCAARRVGDMSWLLRPVALSDEGSLDPVGRDCDAAYDRMAGAAVGEHDHTVAEYPVWKIAAGGCREGSVPIAGATDWRDWGQAQERALDIERYLPSDECRIPLVVQVRHGGILDPYPANPTSVILRRWLSGKSPLCGLGCVSVTESA